METGRGYAVWVPALPGCSSFGRTEAEALENIRGAIRSTLEALEEQNTPFPWRDVEII